jgi:hypothetical protein
MKSSGKPRPRNPRLISFNAKVEEFTQFFGRSEMTRSQVPTDVPRVLRVLRVGCPCDHAAICRIDSGDRPPHLRSMCNRFRSIREWSDIPRDLYRGPRINFEFNPNVAPTELVPVLVAGDGVVLARFGIHVTGPGGKPRPPLLNANMDGMRKDQFRTHLQKQRCVITAEGFYEWREEGGKQPYYFSRKDRRPLMLAGIWQEAEYKGDSE